MKIILIPFLFFLIINILSCQNISNNTNTLKHPLFEFNGDFHTRIILKEFARLNDPSLGRHDNDLEKGEFGLFIDDARDMNPDPTPEQINAIHFLQQHQNEVLASVFRFCKDVVIPHNKTFLPPEEYPESYPKFESIEDLPSFIGVNEIMINQSQKDGYAYIVLGFTSTLDMEHGLYIVMHKLRPLDHGTMGDFSYDKMVEDIEAGLPPETKFQPPPEDVDVDKLIMPHPKYGKLKPWQQSHNQYYPYRFVREDRIDELKEFYKLHPKAIRKYKHTSGLLSLAVRWKKSEAIDFLLTQKPEQLYGAFELALRAKDFQLSKRLIDHVPNINEQLGQNAYLYKILNQFYKNYSEEALHLEYESLIEAAFKKGVNPFLKEKWGRSALYCYRYFDDKSIEKKLDDMIKKYCREYEVEIPEK